MSFQTWSGSAVLVSNNMYKNMSNWKMIGQEL